MRFKVAIFLLFLAVVTVASADTLTLKNGQVIEGTFIGRSQNGVQFVTVSGLAQTFPSGEVANLTFGAVAPPKPIATPKRVTVPAGTVLLVRLNESLETGKTQQGQVFATALSTNLAADGYVVATQGTTVYGNVVNMESAGRAAGKSKMQLQLTQIVIKGNAVPIVTNVFDTEGKSSGKRSARRLLGGAGLGAAIGAIAGDAGMGAAIGAVSGATLSVVQKGDQVQIPAETQLSFTLQQPVTLPVVQ